MLSGGGGLTPTSEILAAAILVLMTAFKFENFTRSFNKFWSPPNIN